MNNNKKYFRAEFLIFDPAALQGRLWYSSLNIRSREILDYVVFRSGCITVEHLFIDDRFRIFL